jgi:hypothetical protein
LNLRKRKKEKGKRKKEKGKRKKDCVVLQSERGLFVRLTLREEFSWFFMN